MQPSLFLIAAIALLLQVAPSWSASEAAKSSALPQGGDDRPEGVRGDPAHLCPLPWTAYTSDTYDHTAGAGIYFSALSGIGG